MCGLMWVTRAASAPPTPPHPLFVTPQTFVVLFAVIKASELVLQLVLDASSFLTHALSFAEIASGISSSTDRIRKQQLQKEQCQEVGPDVSLLVDDLQKQWHDKLNMHLGNTLIRPGSDRKVWWSCDHCPDGLPHIWEATVSNRTYGVLLADKRHCLRRKDSQSHTSVSKL